MAPATTEQERMEREDDPTMPSVHMVASDDSENLYTVDVERGIVVAPIQDDEGRDGTITNSNAPRAPRPIQPGAVSVRGPGMDASVYDDDDFMTTSSVQQPVQEEAVSAEVIDPEEENRKVQERVEREVQETLERERIAREMNIPFAEFVVDRKCSPRVRRLFILGALLAIAAIVLGIVLPPCAGQI